MEAKQGWVVLLRRLAPGIFVALAQVAIVALALAATAAGAVDVAIRPLGLDPVIALVQADGVE